MACPRVFMKSVNLCSSVCKAAAWRLTPKLTKVARVQTVSGLHRQFSCSVALQERLYSKDHEWVLPEENKQMGTVGISIHAQELLGDIVYVELPDQGMQLSKGDAFGVVESVKAASDLYSLVDGKVEDTNSALEEQPQLLNSDPLNEGWIVKMTIDNPDQLNDLMTEEQYQEFIKEAE